MTIFGLDISHHQDERLDLARAKREGIEFVFIKATEGVGFNDAEFAGNLAEARAAGLLVAAYHYQLSGPAAPQVANVRDSVPLDVPVILDVEARSGSVALTRELVDRLRAAGYRVPLLYLPRWYWQQIGSPGLAGLPPLWSSRYPDTVVGSIQDEWADVPAHYWNGYGGLDVAVLQFTSSAAIAGHQPIDANAYRGTREQLAALLGGGQEVDMTGEEHEWLRQIYEALSQPYVQNDHQWLGNLLATLGRYLPAETDSVTEAGGVAKVLEALVADVAELKARPPVQLTAQQIALLADELAARGITGITAAELIDILSGVRLAPAQPEGSTA
ncbi:MAG TPA: glycoside hydrolase family 25 protein [Actinophytocola sp.]|uniref:glycoside hydrolase family 25 protein n=1 Tax=Actinophytocola sp. TaxID=1872138 RepID=UPI002DDD5522|nr:glycoside hydrolase family 25 protein [Actinophytocola sp.]HEV2784704.1 glycoside hydrolase family 25 protein [Actinophytocola sp.]